MRTKIALITFGILAVFLAGLRIWSVNQYVDNKQIVATETSDWKTYTNLKYGVEFKYPSSYSLDESSGLCEEDNTNIELIENKVRKGFIQMGMRCLAGVVEPSHKIDIALNNTPAVKWSWSAPGPGEPHLLYELKNKPIIIILYAEDSILDQILSTFKFTNTSDTSSTSTTTNWKTQTNKEVGYMISYPATYHNPFYSGSRLVNYDEILYERGAPNGVVIDFGKGDSVYYHASNFDLTDKKQQKEFLVSMNKMTAQDLENGVTRTAIESISLGSIIYTNKFTPGTEGDGSAGDAYYAFAPDGESYYEIIVWGGENDPKNVSAILSSFRPI